MVTVLGNGRKSIAVEDQPPYFYVACLRPHFQRVAAGAVERCPKSVPAVLAAISALHIDHACPREPGNACASDAVLTRCDSAEQVGQANPVTSDRAILSQALRKAVFAPACPDQAVLAVKRAFRYPCPLEVSSICANEAPFAYSLKDTTSRHRRNTLTACD